MKLPILKPTKNKSSKQIITFGGINYGQNTRDGELLESKNLSADHYPCLSQRKGRTNVQTYTSPSAVYARGKLCVVDGTDFIYDGNVVGQVLPGKKHFATINTKIVIFPDKICYDTEKSEFSKLEASYTVLDGTVEFSNNKITIPKRGYKEHIQDSSKVYPSTTSTVYYYSGYRIEGLPQYAIYEYSGSRKTATAESIPIGSVIDDRRTSTEVFVVKRKSTFPDGSIYIICERRELKDYIAEEMEGFKEGDCVNISGCVTIPSANGDHIVRSIREREDDYQLTFDENSFTEIGTEEGFMTIARKVPDLSCICESDNRIWGAEGATIYASALGDPTNFFVYDGLSTDSYAVAVGTDGEFTGCIGYGSSVLFWKEDCVHKVLGDYPAQYSVYTYKIPGLQNGSEKSMAIINETLFYKGRTGVYAYNGGSPELLTEKFGTRQFTDAVAGTNGQKYYISMKDEGENWSLFVYDTKRGFWLREDDTHAVDFATLDGKLYFLSGSTNALIQAETDRADEGSPLWSATLCQMDETTHGKKGYSKLLLRCDMAADAWLKVEISVDGGPFQEVFSTHNEHAKTFVLPILPRRCDSFRIRLSGKGETMVKSLVREFTIGSEY